MHKRLPKWLGTFTCAVAALGFATSPIALAQEATTGSVSGVVSDAQTGAPVANAAVTAASVSGVRTAKTNAKGFYVLQSLIPDTYTVSVQAEGYAAQATAGVTVQQEINVTVNARLEKTIKTIANVQLAAGAVW